MLTTKPDDLSFITGIYTVGESTPASYPSYLQVCFTSTLQKLTAKMVKGRAVDR